MPQSQKLRDLYDLAVFDMTDANEAALEALENGEMSSIHLVPRS